jgi:uncharacterized membrane protein
MEVKSKMVNGFGCGMMNGFAGGYGAGMMLFSWVFGITVLVALVLLIVWLAKQIQKK